MGSIITFWHRFVPGFDLAQKYNYINANKWTLNCTWMSERVSEGRGTERESE